MSAGVLRPAVTNGVTVPLGAILSMRLLSLATYSVPAASKISPVGPVNPAAIVLTLPSGLLLERKPAPGVGWLGGPGPKLVTNMLPAWSKTIASAWLRPDDTNGVTVPFGETLLMVLMNGLETKRVPWASNCTPIGALTDANVLTSP